MVDSRAYDALIREVSGEGQVQNSSSLSAPIPGKAAPFFVRFAMFEGHACDTHFHCYPSHTCQRALRPKNHLQRKSSETAEWIWVMATHFPHKATELALSSWENFPWDIYNFGRDTYNGTFIKVFSSRNTTNYEPVVRLDMWESIFWKWIRQLSQGSSCNPYLDSYITHCSLYVKRTELKGVW